MTTGNRVLWVAPLLLWLLAAAVYWGAQDNQPLLGDVRTVWQNPAVSGDDTVGALLGRYEFDSNESHDSVRPVATVANRLRHGVFGDERPSYVWSQVTLHAVCGTLLCLLIASTVGSVGAGLLGGAVFVAHPVVSSSVLGLGGIAEQLALAFGLLCLLTLARAFRTPGRGIRNPLIAAGILLALAIGSKEAAFLFLPVILLWILAIRPSDDRRDPGPWKIWPATSLLAIAVAGLAFRLVSVQALPADARINPAVYPDTGVPFLERMMLGLAAVWTNLQLLIYPQTLSYTYDFLPERLEPMLGILWISGAIFLLVLAGLAVVLTLRGRASGALWLGFLTVGLLASLGFVAPINDFLNERTSYFLLPAVLGTLAWLVVGTGLINKNRYVAIPVVLVSVVASAGLAMKTTTRIDDFENQDTLIRSSIAATGSPRAHYDLGNQFLSRGQYPSARDQYELALEKDPELWMAWINLGAAFSREEDFSLAMRAYDRALEGAADRPEYRVPIAKAHFNRALLLMRQNRNAEAAADLQKTIEILPDHLRAHVSLAFILRNSERFDEQAIHHFRRAIELETTPEAKQRLTEAMDYIYERQEALEMEKEARKNAGQAPSAP